MKLMLSIFLCFFMVSAGAQEVWRCKQRDGSSLIQDRPCLGGDLPAKRPAIEPESSEQAHNPAQKQLERDKEKLRNLEYDRKKNESLDAIEACENTARQIQQSAWNVANAPADSYRPNLAGLMAMNLDEERRQTAMSALQSQAAAKRAECDSLRRQHETRFKEKRG